MDAAVATHEPVCWTGAVALLVVGDALVAAVAVVAAVPGVRRKTPARTALGRSTSNFNQHFAQANSKTRETYT